MKTSRASIVLVFVLLLVNLAAMWGQAGWALDHIVPAEWTDIRARLGLALAFAAALELIGVFLAVSADEADERGLPSGGIRLGSYAQGIVSGLLNASHWGWWTAAAVAFGLMSMISPFLWGISARIRRGRASAPSRRLWHPRRWIKLIREMAWNGDADENEAAAASDRRDAGVVTVKTVPTVLDRMAAEYETKLDVMVLNPETPIITPKPRTPRQSVAGAALEVAIEKLQEGQAPNVVAQATGLNSSTCRRYAAVIRTLAADPSAQIDAKRAVVRADMIEPIRQWAASAR